jgi:hypothetical protein
LRAARQLVGVEARRPATSTKRMVDRAGHLEDDPGVAPLLPPRARLARSPTVALVAAAMLLRRRGVEAI